MTFCRHVYEYTGAEICPDCGNPTHDVDWQKVNDGYRTYYAEGRHLEFIHPVTGATISGWWSI